jgi:hypothetical protein
MLSHDWSNISREELFAYLNQLWCNIKYTRFNNPKFNEWTQVDLNGVTHGIIWSSCMVSNLYNALCDLTHGLCVWYLHKGKVSFHGPTSKVTYHIAQERMASSGDFHQGWKHNFRVSISKWPYAWSLSSFFFLMNLWRCA